MIRTLAVLAIIAALCAGAVSAYNAATAGFERAIATRAAK